MEKSDKIIEQSILDLNRLAMTQLRDSNFSISLSTLKQALLSLNSIKSPEKRLKLKAITYNNFGCFYKQSKMPNVALKYLTKASNSEKTGLLDEVNLASTHLNICAIYSELGKHEKALKESLLSLQLMKSSLNISPNFVSTLVIAYFNTAVEYEFLKDFKNSLAYYKFAWETAEKYLGNTHQLCLNMKNTYLNAESKLGNKENQDLAFKEPIPAKTRNLSAKTRPKSGSFEGFKRTKKTATPKACQNSYLANSNFSLKSVRFLTGSRLQPMFYTIDQGKSRLKTRLKNSEKPLKSAHKPKNFKVNHPSSQNFSTEIFSFTQVSVKNPITIQKKNLAALTIQKFFRGFKSRKLAKSLKKQKSFLTKTLETIQELEVLKKEALWVLSENKGLVRTQGVVLAILRRKEVEREVRSAVVIQKWVRMQQVCGVYNKIRNAVIFIQDYFRRNRRVVD